MTSVQQVQSVAKRLEKMLETALNQLKIEQKMRKESENKLMELELDLVNKEHQIKSLEEQIENTANEKDQKIGNLESTINFLQSVVVQKEKEVLSMQEVIGKFKKHNEESYDQLNLDNSVEKYEETLNRLIGDQDEDNGHIDPGNVSMEDVAYVNEDYNEEEEYVLDESMEELNQEQEDVSLSEDVKPDVEVERRKSIKHKTRCPICQEEFVNKVALQEHQKETGHTVLFDCDVCNKKFKTKSIAQIHKARIHSTVTPFKCSKCDKRFKDQGSCRRHEANDSVHIRMENMKLNPNIICNICGKEFERTRRWCLDQHLLTHLANKKFACDNCGQFYRQKGYLQTHMKVCLDIKSENCEECGETFHTKTALHKHEKDQHSGEKPYECSICTVSFSSYNSYIAHGKNVHNATSAKHFTSIQEVILTSK